VESSLKAASEDADAMLRMQQQDFEKSARKLHMICREMDKDRSGSLTAKELIHGFDSNPRFQQIMALMQIERDECEAVFNILDQDGSGDIDYDEFIKELYKMKSHDQHTMLVFMRYYLIDIRKMLIAMSKDAGHDERCPGNDAGEGGGVGGLRELGTIAPTVLPDTVVEERLEESRLDLERDVRDSMRDLQATVREDLFATLRELVVAAEHHRQSIDDLRHSLPQAQPSRWPAGSTGASPPSSGRVANTPASRCCQFEDARGGFVKVEVSDRVGYTHHRSAGAPPSQWAAPASGVRGASGGGKAPSPASVAPPVRIVGVPAPHGGST